MTSDYVAFVRTASGKDLQIVEEHRAAALRESAKYRGRPAGTIGTPVEVVSFVAGFAEDVLASASLVRVSESEWVVDHVWVQPDAREVGLGDTLMQACIELVRTRAGRRIRASAQPGDRAMKNLFERHGLVAETIIVARDV